MNAFLKLGVRAAIVALFTATTAWAQQPLCPVKEGQSLLYATKNAKGKVQGYTRQTVATVEGSGGNLVVGYTAVALDAKKKPLSDPPLEIEYRLKVQDGTVVYDPKSLLGGVLNGLQEGEATGEPLRLPAGLKAGDDIPDASVKMQIAFMRIDLSYTEGKCVAEESITTAAGAFACFKIEQRCMGRALVKVDMKIVAWYAPGVGVVRQETYNKDKLQNVQELEAVE